jgi:tetratricopeptide (TPR) repeat protein
VNALKVISRTSVMEYRDTTKNVRQIGEELGVDSILEGSVQHIGDAVRINLQLVDARTDEQIWAKTYNQRLTMENIFSVQSEISQSVADALQARLSPDERVRIAAVPTSDLRAYRLYKEARNNLYQRQLPTIRTARSQFEEAVALDPRYADAHAGLAESIMLLSINHQDIPEREAMRLAEASIDRALQLDPDLADAYAIRGLMKATEWGKSRLGQENVEAETAFRRAIELNPNHASAYMWFASLRDSEQRLDEAIELYQIAMELDPLARIPATNLPMVYAKRGEHDAAMTLWLEATRIHSDWPTVHQYVSTHLWGLGRLDEAYAWYAKVRELGGVNSVSGDVDVGVMVDLGNLERAAELLERYPESHPFYPFARNLRHLIEEDYGAAAEGFTRIIEESLLPERYIFDVASNSALLAGDLETAKKYALAADPVLGGDTVARVDRTSAMNAVKLAYIYQREGRNGEASRLLTETLDVIRDLPRLGTHGFGIRDVQIYALLGRREDAITAFREALDAGYRGSILFDGWPLAIDPYLEDIREEPRFLQMVDELEGYLATMRESIYRAEASGQLDELRARTETT